MKRSSIVPPTFSTVRTEPCVFAEVPAASQCDGYMTAHHHGRKGTSQKVSDLGAQTGKDVLGIHGRFRAAEGDEADFWQGIIFHHRDCTAYSDTANWTRTIEDMPSAISTTCSSVSRRVVRLCSPGIRSATAT